MALNFFAEKNFLGSMIRGKQIADYVGGQYRPIVFFKNDTNIYLKPSSLDKIKDGEWVDVSDGEQVVDLLKQRPGIKVIANSLYSYELVKSQLSNEVKFIPQQHLNWEMIKRFRNGLAKCGYIGKRSLIAEKIYGEIADIARNAGLEFEFFSDFYTREDAVKFYTRIDLLIIGKWNKHEPYKTPTKMINAASFGIPSIAYPLPGYKEFEGYYVHLKDLPSEIDRFKDANYYNDFSQKIIKKAEEYHISRIAELYKRL